MLAAPTNRMSNSYPSPSPSGTYSSSSYESYAKAPALPSYHRQHDSSSHMQPMPSHLRTAPSSSGNTGHRESWPPLLLPPISTVTHGHGSQQIQQPQRSPSSLYSHPQQVSPSYSHAHDPRSLATNRHLRPPSPVRRVSGPAATVSSVAPRNDHASMSTGQSTSAVPVANATAPTKKRKRLQRACVPCHKAKRRCDGGLPCSNCDFSGRGCSYSDSQGNAVHPTARAHVRDAMATHTEQPQQRDPQPQQYHHNHQGSFSSTDSHDNFVRPRLSHSSSTLSVRTRPSLGGSDDGQAILEDHLTKFFKTAPFNAILPTAFQDVSGGGPTALLSMAISSFCLDRMAGPSPTRNEYATSIEQLASMAEDERQGPLCEKPSAELIVTTLLQAIHDASLGRMVKAVSAADAAVRLVHDLELDQGALSAADPKFEGAELARLVCLVFVTDVLICVIAGKTSCLHEEDFTLAIHRLTGQYQDAATVAFLSLLRVTHIFVDVVAISKKEARGLYSSSQEAQQSRRACRIRVEEWKSSLDSSVEYNHSNLVAVSRGQGCQDAWAWAWSMMHAMAEVITGLLLAAGTPSDPTSSPKSDDGKKGSSHDSLVVLLDTLGQDHRRSVLSAVPLLVATLLPEQSSRDSHTKAKAWLHEARDGFLLSDDQLNKAAACLGLASVSSPGSQSSGVASSKRMSYPVPALKTSSLSPTSAAPRDGIFGSQASPVSPQDHRRHASLSISSVISSGSTSVYGGERLSPRPPTITTTATSKSPSSPPFRPGQQRQSSHNTLPPIQSMSNGSNGNGNNASLASNSGTLSASLVSTSVPTSPRSAASRSSASSSPVSSSTSLMMYKTSVA